MAKRVTISPKPQILNITKPEEIGMYIKHLRTKLNYTQREAAGLCNLSPSAFLNLERGNPNTSIASILHVCSMLGIKIELSAEE